MAFNYPITIKDSAGVVLSGVLVVLERRDTRTEVASGSTDVNGEITLISDYDGEHNIVVYSPDPQQNDLILRATAL